MRTGDAGLLQGRHVGRCGPTLFGRKTKGFDFAGTQMLDCCRSLGAHHVDVACHKILVCRGAGAIEYELKLRTRRILEMNPADMTGAALANSCNRRFAWVCLQPRDQFCRVVRWK